MENDIQSGNGRLESKIYQLMFMKSCLAGDEIDMIICFTTKILLYPAVPGTQLGSRHPNSNTQNLKKSILNAGRISLVLI